MKRLFVVLSCLTILSMGCGTLMHPERDRDTADIEDLDTQAVILDSSLFFFGVIPGVVAWAVDLSTGALYETKE